MPPVLGLVAVEPANVRLTALKQAEDGNGLILRLVEVDGITTKARVTFAPELLPEGAQAVEVDTMERPLSENTARVEEQVITVELAGFEITTIRIG